MKKKSIFAASYIGVASVWLGGHFGPGFATGAFSAQYYEKYGWIGLVMPLLAMLITGGVMFYMVEYARTSSSSAPSSAPAVSPSRARPTSSARSTA